MTLNLSGIELLTENPAPSPSPNEIAEPIHITPERHSGEKNGKGKRERIEEKKNRVFKILEGKMEIIKIAELLEETIINIVIKNLEDSIIKTDFGIQLNDKKEEVYRTHFSISINFTQDTPVYDCKGSHDPVGQREVSDKERVRILVTELLGFTKK